MILRTEEVTQVIDTGVTGRFIKDVILTAGPHPLGMVRKRLAGATQPCAAVMLIHGFGQNRYTWHSSGRSFVNYLAVEGFDVFNIDLRGHGRSRRFGAPRPQLLDEYIREDIPALAAEVLELAGFDQLYLVGHSMGGLLAYGSGATALKATTAGIVTLGAPYLFGRGSRRLQALAVAAALVWGSGLLDFNPSVPLRTVGRYLQKQRWMWDQTLFPAPLRPWSPGSMEKELLDEYLQQAFDPTSASVALDILQAGVRQRFESLDGQVDYTTAFEMLERPLLIIAGSKDVLAPPASVRPAYERSRSSDKTYRELPLGHIDIVLGRSAPSNCVATHQGLDRSTPPRRGPKVGCIGLGRLPLSLQAADLALDECAIRRISSRPQVLAIIVDGVAPISSALGGYGEVVNNLGQRGETIRCRECLQSRAITALAKESHTAFKEYPCFGGQFVVGWR